VARFKISFESRRCCNVRERVARDCKVREKRARSCVQCKVERFDQVERRRPFCPDLPHGSRSFVLYQKARQVLYNNVSFHVSLRKRQNEVLEKKAEGRLSLPSSSPAKRGNTEKDQPRHSSIRLKKIEKFWSGRIGLRNRALAKERVDGLVCEASTLFAFHAPCTGSPPPLRFLKSLAEIEKAVDELSPKELTELAAYIARRD
jgi:hypothetical protein